MPIPESKNSSHAQDCAIFLAGGSGRRMAGRVGDKVLAPLCGVPVVAHSVRAFAESGVAGTAIFVCRDNDQRRAIEEILAAENLLGRFAKIMFCHGGKERGDSVLNGLKCARAATVAVENLAFIHDCARPLVAAGLLRELAEVARREGAAVLAHRCVNTVKRVPAGLVAGTACVAEDLERDRLWEMETPQVFPLGKILQAYEKTAAGNLRFTDDVSVFSHALGGKVAFVENPTTNPKITVPTDLALAEILLRQQ